MAKRSVRRARRQAAHSRSKAPAECEAQGCPAYPFDRVYVPEKGREVAVCAEHGKMLRVQMKRNENSRIAAVGGKAEADVELVTRELRG